MTRIAIIGGGRAATLHAEAARATPGVELVGVGGRPVGSAATLAAAVGVPDLPVAELVGRSDGIVVAVPPRAVAAVLRDVAPDHPVLIESPVGIDGIERSRAMTAVNLLHAGTVKRALRAIRELGTVHHLVLRSTTRRPSWGLHGTPAFGGGALIDPAAGLLPVLLAAAGSPVVGVTATVEEDGPVDTAAALHLDLADGRRIGAELSWSAVPGETEIEAAAASGVVLLRLWPRPELEIDGRLIAPADEPPLVALGFVEQMRRFAGVAAGRDDPWPPRSVGDGIMAIAEAAARSARSGGSPLPCGMRAETDPARILAHHP